MAKGNKKPLRPIEVLVAFVMVFGLGYIIFILFLPKYFMWIVTNILDKSH